MKADKYLSTDDDVVLIFRAVPTSLTDIRNDVCLNNKPWLQNVVMEDTLELEMLLEEGEWHVVHEVMVFVKLRRQMQLTNLMDGI